jgi:FkbM family methyltransferase
MLEKTISFRGHPIQIAYLERMAGDPSWYTHEDERSVRDQLWNIQPGDVILDVGAAYGSYSLTALACGASLVMAWSPEGHPGGPPEADVLRESLGLNDWRSRCIIWSAGCYSEAGWLNTVTQEFSKKIPDGPCIYVSPLDWQVPSRDFPKNKVWMKLDVEGAEVEVLKGAAAFITTVRPKILVENHLFKRASIADEVRELLVGTQGYRHITTLPYHSVSHSLYLPNEVA